MDNIGILIHREMGNNINNPNFIILRFFCSGGKINYI